MFKMNQHFNNMLEHLSTSLRRKNTENAQQASSNDKQVPSQSENDHKDVTDFETVNNNKSKGIFKNLISSDKSAANIFQNLIKGPENITSHLTTAISSTTNGNCIPKLNGNGDSYNNSNNQQSPSIVHPNENDIGNNVNTNQTTYIGRKRNSIARSIPNSNGELTIQRELSPSPRTHRKSSHDIRLLRNNQMLEGADDVGKFSGGVVKPLKTKNVITKNENFDTLHSRAIDVSNSPSLFQIFSVPILMTVI